MTDNISKMMNMVPLEVAQQDEIEIIQEGKELQEYPEVNKEVHEDLIKARKNVSELADLAQEAVAELAILASQAQDHKVYDALSKMIKSALDSNKDLMQIHKDKIELTYEETKDQKEEEEKPNLHQHIHVGSTKELLEILKGMRENNKEE